MITNRSITALAACLALLTTFACTTASPPPASGTAAAGPAPAPGASPAPAPAHGASPAPASAAPAEHIKVQHVLISFAGKVPGKNVTRTRDEARALAAQILERAKKGEDFGALVSTYTDDQAPGIYALSNSGVAPASGEFSRDRMVPAFGDVGFSLARGEIGIAEYDPRTSPYGWHVIKRLE